MLRNGCAVTLSSWQTVRDVLAAPDEVRNVLDFYLFVRFACVAFFFLSHSSLHPWFNQKAGKHTLVLCQEKVLSARGMAEKQIN